MRIAYVLDLPLIERAVECCVRRWTLILGAASLNRRRKALISHSNHSNDLRLLLAALACLDTYHGRPWGHYLGPNVHLGSAGQSCHGLRQSGTKVV